MPIVADLDELGVLTIMLDNDDGNLIDLPLARELANTTDLLRQARCVLLQGAGRNFCLGGNLAQFAEATDRQAFIRELADTVHVFVRALAGLTVPTVAATNGWAAGAGMSLTLACDLVVAGESSGYRTGYPSLGLTPDAGMTWSLPRRVGSGPAIDLLLTGRPLSVDEAHRLGLVTRIVPDDSVREAAADIARALATGPIAALSGTKTLIRQAATNSLPDHLDREADSIVDACVSPEGNEGIDAFNARRTPVFVDVA